MIFIQRHITKQLQKLLLNANVDELLKHDVEGGTFVKSKHKKFLVVGFNLCKVHSQAKLIDGTRKNRLWLMFSGILTGRGEHPGTGIFYYVLIQKLTVQVCSLWHKSIQL